MNESVFKIEVKGESLFGIWHPAQADKLFVSSETVGMEKQLQDNPLEKKKAIVFLHGWGGYRTGPHDMLVKMARYLARQGYHCFRFDFRGKGYSEGDGKSTGSRSMLEDLEAVLRFVDYTLHDPEITLAGICSGARLALFYAQSGVYPIAHVIELSSPVLRQEEVQSAVAANQAKHTLYLYIHKLFRRDTWLKLSSGEVHFKAVCRNLGCPVYRFLSSMKKQRTTGASGGISGGGVQGEKKPFAGLNGQVLLVHGGKDPETQLALSQIRALLTRHAVAYDVHVVKNANHSFYGLHWEQEIIEKIGQWLAAR